MREHCIPSALKTSTSFYIQATGAGVHLFLGFNSPEEEDVTKIVSIDWLLKL